MNFDYILLSLHLVLLLCGRRDRAYGKTKRLKGNSSVFMNSWEPDFEKGNNYGKVGS